MMGVSRASTSRAGKAVLTIELQTTPGNEITMVERNEH
jgi:hypothetical protein